MWNRRLQTAVEARCTALTQEVAQEAAQLAAQMRAMLAVRLAMWNLELVRNARNGHAILRSSRCIFPNFLQVSPSVVYLPVNLLA